jgi:hypothetical protein
MVDLYADRPERAHASLRAAHAQLSPDEVNVSSFMALYTEMQLALYEAGPGALDAAHARFDACEARFARSFLLRGPTFRILFWDLRARVALGAAAGRPGSPPCAARPASSPTSATTGPDRSR